MYAEPLLLPTPQWSGRVRQRLHLSLLLSAACLAAILPVLRFPAAEQAGPVTELFVRLLIDDVELLPESPSSVTPPEEPAAEAADHEAPSSLSMSESGADTAQVRPPTDWYALIPDAARAVVAEEARPASANPAFDERRRQAAIKFAPSKAPQATPIWENVEKDALGRSVLWSGDCYRVIDDPNAGSREAFETFGQYLVSCIGTTRTPRNLPFVKEIRNRRAGPPRSVPPAAE